MHGFIAAQGPRMIEFFNHPMVKSNFFNSLVIFLLFISFRYFTVRAIRKLNIHNLDTKRQWIVQVKNTSLFVFLLGLLIIWSAELQTFALSIVAIAAALVLATKEMILCFLGGMLKTLTRPFKIGDRIEVNNYRGVVVNADFLTTQLMELGPLRFAHQYTGKNIIIPNSLYLSNPIINETKSFKFVLHTFVIPIPYEYDIKKHQSLLLEAAQEECNQYVEKVHQYMEKVDDLEGLEIPTTEPKVAIAFPDEKRIDLVVRVPIPSDRSGRIQQAIINRYLELRGSIATAEAIKSQ